MKFVLSFFLCVLCNHTAFGQTLQDANSLYTQLATNYNRKVRPEIDQSEPTYVYMSAAVLYINEFEEKNNKLSSTLGFHIEWIDERIRWNSSEYGGIEFVQLPKDDVWLPVIGLVNMYESVSLLSELDTRVHYNSEGYALWVTGGLYTVVCAADVAFYPFDTQECVIAFTQIGYRMTELLIYPGEIIQPAVQFVQNGIWERTSISLSREVDDILDFQVIHVKLKLRRRFDFYAVTLLAPITITMFCNLFVFLIPATSGERVSFSVTILLALSVFMTIVSDTLPKNSYPTLPYLCFFILMDVLTSSVITACSIITVRVYCREDSHKIPLWLECLCRRWCLKHRKASIAPQVANSVAELKIAKNCSNHSSENEYIEDRCDETDRRLHLKNGDHKCSRRMNIDNFIKSKDCKVSWKDVGFCLDMMMLIFFVILTVIKIFIYIFMYTYKKDNDE